MDEGISTSLSDAENGFLSTREAPDPPPVVYSRHESPEPSKLTTFVPNPAPRGVHPKMASPSVNPHRPRPAPPRKPERRTEKPQGESEMARNTAHRIHIPDQAGLTQSPHSQTNQNGIREDCHGTQKDLHGTQESQHGAQMNQTGGAVPIQQDAQRHQNGSEQTQYGGQAHPYVAQTQLYGAHQPQFGAYPPFSIVPPVTQQFPTGNMAAWPATVGSPVQSSAEPGDPFAHQNRKAVRGISITVLILAICSFIFEAASVGTENIIDRPTPLPATFTAPGIWVGIAGIVCGAVASSASESSTRSKSKLVAATILSFIYLVLLFIQFVSSAVLVGILNDLCINKSRSYYTRRDYNCEDSRNIHVRNLQAAVLIMAIIQGILMIAVTGMVCTAACCPARRHPAGYPPRQMVPQGHTVTTYTTTTGQPFYPGPGIVPVHSPPVGTSGYPGGPVATGTENDESQFSERAKVNRSLGRFVAKISPKDFAKCAQKFGDRTSEEQIRIISRYISNSSEALLNSVLSADELIEYDQGEKNGTHLMMALKDKGVIFQASDGLWYYDKFVPVLEAVGELALKDELLQEMSDCDAPAPAVSGGRSDEKQTKQLLQQLAETIKQATENAAVMQSAALGSSGAPLEDTRRVKTKRGTFVANRDPKKFGLFAVSFGEKVTLEQLKKLALYVFQLNQEDYNVQVISADELSQFERGQLDGGFFLEKLLGKGLIFEGSDGTYYYDGLAMILQETGEIELRNSMLDEKTNELEPSDIVREVQTKSGDTVTEGDQPEPEGDGKRTEVQADPDYYIAKEYPKKYAKFADNFRGMISLERLVKMADYIFRSGDEEFGRQLLSADERTKFQKGKKNGRHLIQKLKEGGVIFSGPDGIFNYDGLARILEALQFHDIIADLLEKKSTHEAAVVPEVFHLLQGEPGVPKDGETPNMATMLATSHSEPATWKTETLIARESPGNFGKFAENFRRWVTADEVVKLAHFVYDSRTEFGVQVLTADELTEFEAGNIGPGRLLTKLKDRGIIYNGPGYVYYYDGLAIILEQVEMHGLINQLLVKKSETVERNSTSWDPTGSSMLPTFETADQTEGDIGFSSIPQTLIAKNFHRNFGLFVIDFADKVTHDQVVMLARYTYNSSETDFGLHVLGTDELLEFERGEKKGQHFVAKLRDRGVVAMGPGHFIYYDGLAKILKEVGLHDVMEELLKKKSDADLLNSEEEAATAEPATEDNDGTSDDVTVPTSADAGFLYVARNFPDDFGMFTENFNRKMNKEGVRKLANYIYHSRETELEGKRVLTADEWEEFDSGKKEGAYLVTKLRDCGVIVSDSEGIYNYGGLAKMLQAVGLHHICDILLENISPTGTEVPDQTQEDISEEPAVEPHAMGRWARLRRQLFGAGKKDKQDDQEKEEKEQDHRKWVSSKLPQNFAAFCIRFNREMTSDHVKEMAFYACHAFEYGAFPSPLISKDELVEFQNGKKSGMELLNTLRKKQLIIRGDDAIFYYDGLVDVLETLENHELVASLFVKAASQDKTNQAASVGQEAARDDETVEVETEEQTGLEQTDTPDESGESTPPIPDGSWVSAEYPTDFAAFCISFYRQVIDRQVYEIVTYICYAGEDEFASNQIITTEEMSEFRAGQRTAVDLLRILKARGIIKKGKDGVYFYDGLVALLNILKMTDLVSSLLVEKENGVPEIELLGGSVEQG